MNREWMSANRRSVEFQNGVKEFIKFAVDHADDKTRIICPCLECCYTKRIDEIELLGHILFNGIDEHYRFWDKHGETKEMYANSESMKYESNYMFDDDDLFEGMTKMLEDDIRDCPKMFDKLKTDSETPLYEGCTRFSRLLAVLRLYNLKVRNGWTDKSFTDLLVLLKDMLPDNNVLPVKTYDAKQMLCSIGMSYERIHACPNDCILFRNEKAPLNECSECHAPRYKRDKVPAKVLWYFPIIPRFRRMFRSAEDAKHLTWHADERIQDNMLRHPADSLQWKKIDHDFSDFGEEARNLRLVLSTDGMNPHGVQSSSHSTWPVLIMIYNLSPSLCMKRKFMMMSMLISGPQQPGNDIDIYLAPLIEDLKRLWDIGVQVYDGHREESFNLRALLFGTINDFPAYGNLSGYSVKGQCGCPHCEENTFWVRLQHGKKNAFLGNRQRLPRSHHYRRMRKAFNGSTEEGRAPRPRSGDEVFDMVKDLDCKFGKPFAKDLPTKGYKKKSIFFDSQISMDESETTPCQFELPNPCRTVAKGKVHNKSNQLHHRSLPPNQAKVEIEIVEKKERDTPLPVPNEEHDVIYLKDALGTFVAWPIEYIKRLDKASGKCNENKTSETMKVGNLKPSSAKKVKSNVKSRHSKDSSVKNMKSSHSKGSISSPIKQAPKPLAHPVPFGGEINLDPLPPNCQLLGRFCRMFMQDGNQIEIDMEKEIFNISYRERLGKE